MSFLPLPDHVRARATASWIVAAAVALVVALPGAAQAKSCGNAIAQAPGGYGASDFNVYATSCRTAVRTMRIYFRRSAPRYVNGWRITHKGYRFTGRRNSARFTCYLYGTD
jgi:hypothetical protein